MDEFFQGLYLELSDLLGEGRQPARIIQERAKWLHGACIGESEYFHPHLWHSSGLAGHVIATFHGIGKTPETAIYEAGLMMGSELYVHYCSGQLIPDTFLSFSSSSVGGSPPLTRLIHELQKIRPSPVESLQQCTQPSPSLIFAL